MKKIIALAMLSLLGVFAFCQDRAFVNTDVLKVRDKPGLEGTKVSSLKFSDPVKIYETKGSGEYRDGVLDKWCRISPDGKKEEWVNYLYLSVLPAMITYPYASEVEKYNAEDCTNVNEQLPEFFTIKDVTEEKGTRYFIIDTDDSYYHEDGQNIKVKAEPVLKSFLPASYHDALSRISGVEIFANNETDSYYSLDINGEYISYGYNLPEGAMETGNGSWKLPSFLKGKDPSCLKVQDNLTLRKYSFCKASYPLISDRKYDAATVFAYGIKIGMKRSTVEELIGQCDEIKGNDYYYEDYPYHHGVVETVILKFENDRIKDFGTYLEK